MLNLEKLHRQHLHGTFKMSTYIVRVQPLQILQEQYQELLRLVEAQH